MVNRAHVIDPDVRRRARISRELHAHPLHVEIYEDIGEFVDVAPQEGLIFLADVPVSNGHRIGQIAQHSILRLPVVAYAESPSPKAVVEAMLAGAFGYLEWPFDRGELDVTLKRIADEGTQKLKRERVVSEATAQVQLLSRREKEVLAWLVNGLSNKDIGQTLAISPRTVEIHRSHMMMKLGARSVADAVRIGLYAGLDGVGDVPRFQ